MNTRRGLGRGLGALIPTAPVDGPVDAPVDGPAHGPVNESVDGLADGAGGSEGSPAGAAEPAHAGPHVPADERGGATADQAPARGDVERLTPVVGARFSEIDVTAISPNPRQPRTVFEEEAMAELVHSIREVGLLQPIVVRPLGDGRYELIMGERRWRATKEAGLDVIPAIVRDTSDDALLRDALLENLHRAELNPLEEAAAYQQLLDDFGCTHDDLAVRIGRSRPQISNTLRLLKLGPAVQRRVAAAVLSAGHARALLGVTDTDVQDRLAQRVVAEGLSVRSLEEIVALGEYGEGAGDETGTPVPRRRRPVAPGLSDLADRLSDRFETRVKVDLGKTKGRITVEFASLEDLERIVDLMDPRRESAAG
ncbi:MAG TPA: ParB/RepB/Spo0J family partition protein [Nocardioidaceae bacterium]|nr:ParB/RepB/Spo0J family partition protein [Nocardioidaceae bacterium]